MTPVGEWMLHGVQTEHVASVSESVHCDGSKR